MGSMHKKKFVRDPGLNGHEAAGTRKRKLIQQPKKKKQQLQGSGEGGGGGPGYMGVAGAVWVPMGVRVPVLPPNYPRNPNER